MNSLTPLAVKYSVFFPGKTNRPEDQIQRQINNNRALSKKEIKIPIDK
jgi:hypothetical protein